MSDATSEMPLTGGNTNDAVVRVGDTVRRSSGPWTPSVHALLRHLHDRGFTAAPRALGIDERGREVLTFVPGAVVHPEHNDLLDPAQAVVQVFRLIRSLHDALESFDIPHGAVWQELGADKSGQVELMCHNDLAPWNLIHGPDGWSFIDWDLAAPGRKLWDLAWAFHTIVGLWPTSRLSDAEVGQRFARAAGAYGLPKQQWEALFSLIVERTAEEVTRLREGAQRGEPSCARLVQEGHDRIWAEASAHVEAKAGVWLEAARSCAVTP